MNTICYARISTNNTDQFVSLNNQINLIENFVKTNKIENTINIYESKSISNEMSKKVRDLCTKNEKVNIIVTSLDRLSRNVSDLNFIKKHVDKIYVISEKKIYNPRTDWKKIILSNLSSMEEIEKIKFRIKQNSNKRQRTEDDIILDSKRRCKNIYSILSEKYDEDFLEDLCNFIRKSQHLTSENDLYEFDSLYYFYSNKQLISLYQNCNFDNAAYHITKPDLIGFIKNIFEFQKLNFSEDDPILKEYINSNINYAKKNITSEDNQAETNGIETITSNLQKLLSNNELNKHLNKTDLNNMTRMLEKLNKNK
jgi:DNA invertase Pin-like site-specific DNA recombinase